MRNRRLLAVVVVASLFAVAILSVVMAIGPDDEEQHSEPVASLDRAEPAAGSARAARAAPAPTRRPFDLGAMVAAVAASPDPAAWVDRLDGTVEQDQGDGTILVTSEPPGEPKRPGVLRPVDFVLKHRETQRAMQQALNPPGERKRSRDCLLGLRPIPAEAKWTAILHLKGDGKTMKVERVEISGHEWPPFFTQRAKDCYVNSIQGRSWPSPEVAELQVEYGFSVFPFPSAEQLAEMPPEEREAVEQEMAEIEEEEKGLPQ